MPIQPIQPSAIPAIRQVEATPKASASGNTQAVTQTFEKLLSDLNQSQQSSDALMAKMAQGENVDLHTVMIGMEESSVKMNVAIGIRDKLVDAYREIMRMQV
jgi:flagellar hook-basal body complex protein FliE